MEYNVINEYISFVNQRFLEFFKIVLGNKYQKNLTQMFIDKYIEVRYYNETDYLAIKDIVDRINKELVKLAEKVADDDNIDDIKNIVALFAYLVYFDNAAMIENERVVIDSLVCDNVVKVDNALMIKKALLDWYKTFSVSKNNFSNLFLTKDFSLVEKKLYRKINYLELEHNIKISNLYSEYAIDRAYNTGVVNEDKLFVNYILASSLVLNNAINLDFSRFYLVPFSSTLFEKEKKCARLLNVLDNKLAKKFIAIRITYTDYKKNKKKIDDLISQGYTFGIELDSKYTGMSNELVLFPYILVYEDNPEYEMLIRDKDKLKSKIVKL